MFAPKLDKMSRYRSDFPPIDGLLIYWVPELTNCSKKYTLRKLPNPAKNVAEVRGLKCKTLATAKVRGSVYTTEGASNNTSSEKSVVKTFIVCHQPCTIESIGEVVHSVCLHCPARYHAAGIIQRARVRNAVFTLLRTRCKC